jgi:LuxR family transcriptional regulator, maltose regulon positive regulatory protein
VVICTTFSFDFLQFWGTKPSDDMKFLNFGLKADAQHQLLAQNSDFPRKRRVDALLFHGYDYFVTNEPHSSNEPLLHSKLLPPRLHSSVLVRSDLLLRLDESMRRKLTLVTAPTGFGKTTLVSLWLGQRRIPSAWVTLDAHDNDPVRFWTYVITALRTVDPAVGKTALGALSTGQMPSFQSILIPLINELAQVSRACALVLDDYHAIPSQEIHKTVAFFIQNLPEPLHLILLSRSEPDLPLGILRARDELLEIETGSLRFSLAETEAFLHETLKDEISPAAIVKLHERSEGWAAGLRLAALACNAQDPEAVIDSFSGSHHFVADYLIREVFASQPEAVRAFLLNTCFLNRLTGSLCNAIASEWPGADDRADAGERMLEQLERQNLFLMRLERGSGRTWYRYNPMFAESMQTLARQQLGEAGVAAIFEKASAWYEYQNLFDEAIECAIEAKQFERVVALVEKFLEIYDLNEMYTIGRWMEKIPAALVLKHPAVCLAYAQVILFTSDRFAAATALRMQPFLRAAEETWRASSNGGKVGTVLALRGMMLVWQGDYQKAFECVYAALELLPESDIFWRGISLLNAAAGEQQQGRNFNARDQILEARALLGTSQNRYGVLAANQMLGEVFYSQGDHAQAAQVYEQIITDAVGEESMFDDQGSARYGLAVIAYEQNDLEMARERALQALDFSQRRANETLEADATVLLANIAAAKGEFEAGMELLRSMAARLQNPAVHRVLQDAQARYALWMSKPDGLGWWLALAVQEEKTLFLQKQKQTYLLARLKIANGKADEALNLIGAFIQDAVEQGRVRDQVEGLCIEALAQRSNGNSTGAMRALSQALAIGQEKGFRRLFLDEGMPMAVLLREGASGLTRGSALYATTLLHLFPQEGALSSRRIPGATPWVEPLSQQEIRVLRLLVAGMANGEIAQELVVSTNTVKTHVKNIYRKLDIGSRDEARVVARELKLV